MNKSLRTLGIVCTMIICNLMSLTAQAEDIIKLPAANKTGGKPLMQALNSRQSNKQFSTKSIDEQTLANILWAAVGVNRENGKLTIPTAMNHQDIEVYVVRADGIWLYDVKEHLLRNISTEDARPMVAKQAYAAKAPLALLYVTNNNETPNMQYAAMHAGSAYQNVGLYCASAGLANVVRSSIDKRKLSKAMQLAVTKSIIISQSIGWPASAK